MVRHDEVNEGPKIQPGSESTSTTPAIVVVVLGGVLFLMGIIAVTTFFFRRKSSVLYRKSGVYLTNRSLAEEIPLRSQIRQKSDAAACGGRTPHLVMKKSPSPPYAASTSRNASPITPEEMGLGVGGGEGRKIARIAIHTNPICNTATYCEVHGSTKCNHSSAKSSNHLVKKENSNSKSPRASPQISPSTSNPVNLSPQEQEANSHALNQRNGNLTDVCETTTEAIDLKNSISTYPSTTRTTTTTNRETTAGPGTSTSSKLTGGGQNNLGTLHFRIRYKEEKGTLVVTVVKLQDLPVQDAALMTCDPYVKLQLLPEKQQRVKTRVLRHTRQPVFDEDFSFYGVQPNQLEEMTLHFVMLSFDRYSRDDVIGEVFYKMESLDIANTETAPMDVAVDIQPRNYKMQTQGRGEVLLSLCWQPGAGRLTVVVLKARNLPKMDVSGLADPYVKLYLQYDGQRLLKKKTHVKKKNLNPVYNETFHFDLPPAAMQTTNLDKVSLQVVLLDYDRVTKNEEIGRLEFGSGSSSPTATHHWSEVLNCPRRQIAEWHKLLD